MNKQCKVDLATSGSIAILTKTIVTVMPQLNSASSEAFLFIILY